MKKNAEASPCNNNEFEMTETACLPELVRFLLCKFAQWWVVRDTHFQNH